MGQPDGLKHQFSMHQVGEEECRKAALNTAWLNRDTPEDIPDMLDALGLKDFAADMRGAG